MGIPCDNVDGVNLLEKIYNHNNIETQGSNGVAYALIALDAMKTEIPENAKWTRDKLVSTLLKYQATDGSFTLSSGDSSGSVDMTAMCLQGLANYNNDKYPKVQESIKKGLDYLRKSMESDGGYGNSNSDA